MTLVTRGSPLCPWTSTGLQSRRRTLSWTQFINWWRRDKSLPRRSVLSELLTSWSGWTTGQDCSFMMTFSTGGVLIPMKWNGSSCCALSSFALSCASCSTMTWDTWGRTGPLRFAKIASSGLEWATMGSSGLPSVSDVPVPRLHHYLSVLHWRTSSPVNQWRWLLWTSSPSKMDVVEPPMCWSWLTISRSLPWLCQQPTRGLGPQHVCSLIPSSFTMDSLPESIVIKAGISKVGSVKSSVP